MPDSDLGEVLALATMKQNLLVFRMTESATGATSLIGHLLRLLRQLRSATSIAWRVTR
jgi:hypothetical protein